MDRIKIYNATKTDSILMPRCRYSIGGEEVKVTTTMASGKVVTDTIGHRRIITASWEYVPDTDIKKLHSFLRSGAALTVEYDDIVDGPTEGVFVISYPETGIFKFIEGVPMWYGVSLTMTAQGVG